MNSQLDVRLYKLCSENSPHPTTRLLLEDETGREAHSVPLHQSSQSFVCNTCAINLYKHCAVTYFCFWPGCGGMIHADTGTIKSPNYPQNFPANVECSWQIIAHEGNHLEMSFNSDFQIPDSSGTCQSSYIKVPVLSYSRMIVQIECTAASKMITPAG